MSIQKRPANRWKEQRGLGDRGGGMNSGIFIVTNQRGKAYIEKRMREEDINNGHAEREILALQQVSSHPYITTMVDHFIDYRRFEASIYLARCTGSSMEELIQRHARNNYQKIAERYIWQWFIQITEALCYCHFGPRPDHPQSRSEWNSIWHRDIKPANILLMQRNDGVHARLADFGGSASKELVRQGHCNPLRQSIVTEHFAPPESPRYILENRPQQPAGPNYSSQLNNMIRKSIETSIEKRPKSDRMLSLLEKSSTKLNKLPRGPPLCLPLKDGASGFRRRG